MNNKVVILSGFGITILTILVIIYLFRNREDLTAADITDKFLDFPTDSALRFINLFDEYGQVKTRTAESYIWTPINDGITKAYLKLSNDLANSVTTKTLNVTGTFNLLPRGVILAWGGGAPPDGWGLCDGSNGTPDLRGRFMLGWGTGPALNSTGGEERVTLTVKEMPAHSHGYSFTDVEKRKLQDSSDRVDGTQKSRTVMNSTAPAGENMSHNNMPPYYVVNFIMRLV